MNSRSVRIVAAFAVIYLVWGSTYLAIGAAVRDVPPFLMAGARFSAAGGLLYALARFRGAPRPTRAHWVAAAVLGGLFFLAANGVISFAEAQGLPSSAAALFVTTVPLWILVFDRLLHRTPLHPRQLLGMGLGVVGTAVLVGGAEATGVDPMLGALVLAGAACWGLGSHLAPKLARPSDGALSAAMQMLMGGAGALLVSVASGESVPDPSALSVSAIASFVYLVLVGSILAFRCYLFLLDNVAATRVSTYAFVNPLVAAALGVAVGEPFGWRSAVAMGLVLAAVSLTLSARSRISRPRCPRRPRPASSPPACRRTGTHHR